MAAPSREITPLAVSAPAPSDDLSPWLALVAEKVRTLQYGSVQITVHDSHVVQVERIERHRFDATRRS